MTTQLAGLRAHAATRATAAEGGASNVIVVASGKGGVGASTTAALLAIALAHHGVATLLVDGGEHVAALHHLLGAGAPHPLAALAGGAVTPAQLVREVLPGLALVSGVARAGEDGAPASPAERQLLARRVTALFDAYDAVVVDAGSRLEQILAAAAPAGGPAPQLLVVTSADPIAAAATYALVKVLAQRAPATAVALLVAGADAPTAGAAHATVSGAAEQFLGRTVPLAGAVPDDPSLRRAVLGGMPLQDATDGSPAAEAARAVALRAFDRFTVPPRTAGRPGPSAAPHQPHRASA